MDANEEEMKGTKVEDAKDYFAKKRTSELLDTINEVNKGAFPTNLKVVEHIRKELCGREPFLTFDSLLNGHKGLIRRVESLERVLKNHKHVDGEVVVKLG